MEKTLKKNQKITSHRKWNILQCHLTYLRTINTDILIHPIVILLVLKQIYSENIFFTIYRVLLSAFRE